MSADPLDVRQRAIDPDQRGGCVTLRETGPCHQPVDPAACVELPVYLQQDFRLGGPAHVE